MKASTTRGADLVPDTSDAKIPAKEWAGGAQTPRPVAAPTVDRNRMHDRTTGSAERAPNTPPTGDPNSLAEIWRRLVEDLKALRDRKDAK